MVVATLHSNIPGPFQMELISDWIETLSQANQVARKRPSSSTSSTPMSSPTATTVSSSASSSRESLLLPLDCHDDNDDENTEYYSLPSFSTGYSTPASMLSMPRMPARASLKTSRRASDLVRDSSLDRAMERRATSAAAASPRWWFW